LQFKDGHFDGTVEADAITVGGTAVLTGGAETAITSILNTSLVLGRDADNDIDFGTDNNIIFRAGAQDQIKLIDGALAPVTDNDVDLGTSSLEFKDAFFDGTVTADAFAGPLTGDVTGTASVATTVTITDNESTNEDNAIIFTAGGDVDGGNIGLESDGTLTYNPSTGKITATGFIGTLTGNADTATALATGRTIGMTGDVVWTSASFTGAGNVTGSATIQADAVESGMLNDNIISGQTEISSGLADADELLYSDGGVLKRVGLDTLSTKVLTGNAASATILATARAINGVDFDGSAAITVTAAGSTLSDTVTVAKGGTNATSLADKAVLITQDSGTDTVSAAAMSTNGQLLIGGSSGPAVATLTAGSNVTITNADGGITIASTQATDATNSSHVLVTDNESTDEDNLITFVENGTSSTGNVGLEMDGTLTYNPSTGKVTATGFVGTLTGNVTGNASGTAATVTGAAQSNITSLGTLTTLTVDNVITNGTTIGHTDDTDLMTLADGSLTLAGDLKLADGKNINLTTPLLAGTDETATGITAQMKAGAAITAFQLVCIHSTTQEIVPADASAAATSRAIGLALADIADTNTGTILLHGFFRDDTYTFTTGGVLFLSETTGALTHTAPTTGDAFVQAVGIALSPDVVFINPSLDVIQHA